jgi:hypothetical protein
MNLKEVSLGFDKTWFDEKMNYNDTPVKIKSWADLNVPHNYYCCWYSGDNENIVFELHIGSVPEKIISHALLSLSGVELLNVAHYNMHPEVEHLFEFKDLE